MTQSKNGQYLQVNTCYYQKECTEMIDMKCLKSVGLLLQVEFTKAYCKLLLKIGFGFYLEE